MTNLHCLKRDLLLKDSFNQKIVQFGDTKLPPLVVKTSLKRGLANKESLVGGAFYLEMITGQKAIGARAKKSNALFKTREGDIIGWQVTLRNAVLDHFLFKWTKAILPLEENLYQVSNLSLFLELNEQILPDNVTMHVQFGPVHSMGFADGCEKSIDNSNAVQTNEKRDGLRASPVKLNMLLLSGYNFPIQWLTQNRLQKN